MPAKKAAKRTGGTKLVQNHEALSFTTKPNAVYQNATLCRKAHELKHNSEEPWTWAEVATELELPSPTVARLASQVHEAGGPISFNSEEQLLVKLAQARDSELQGWFTIGARLGGISERKVEQLYEQHTGTTYHTSEIGKGGRKPSTDGARPAAKRTAKKATAKKATAKKGRVPKFPDEPTAEQVGKKLNGKSVSFTTRGGASRTVTVIEVSGVRQNKAGAWGANVVDDGDKKVTIPLASITGVAAA